MAFEIDPRPRRRPQVRPPLCIHHWVIDSAEGAKSGGRCKHCGEQRRFSSSLEADAWTPADNDNRLEDLVAVAPERQVELADER